MRFPGIRSIYRGSVFLGRRYSAGVLCTDSGRDLLYHVGLFGECAVQLHGRPEGTDADDGL